MPAAWARTVLCEGRNAGWWADARLFPSDDCSLVFTTSRGHVATAPAVPPALNINKYKIFDKVDFTHESKSFDIKISNISF